MKLVQNRWLYVAVLALCFGLYINTLSNQYALDDWFVTTSKQEQVSNGLAGIPEIFSTHFITWENYSVDYRPLVKATYAIEYEFFGENPTVSHFVNMLLYAITCSLLLSLLLKLFSTEKRWLLFFSVLLFCVHPIHTEVVASLKGRDELLSFLFLILALRSVINWSEKEKWIQLVFTSVFLYLSLISKGSSIPWIGVIAYVLLFIRKKPFFKVIGVTAVMMAVVVLHFTVVELLLGSIARTHIFIETPFFLLEDLSAKWPSIISAAGYYLKLLVAPFPLCSYYGFNQVPVSTWADWRVYLTILAYVLLIITSIRGLVKPTLFSFGAIIILLDISPFLNIVYPYTGILGERVLYGATIGLTLMVTSGLSVLLPSQSDMLKNGWFPRNKMLLGIFAVLIVLGTAQTIDRNKDWKNHLSLFAADSENCNQSAKIHELHGLYLRGQYINNDVKEWKPLAYKAIAAYKKCLSIYKKWPIPHHRIGVIYHYDLLQPDSALMYYQEASRLNPGFIAAKEDLGQCFRELGQHADAANCYDDLINAFPTDFNYWNKRSGAYFLAGDLQSAKNSNVEFITRFPSKDEPQIHQGNVFLAEGDTAQAMRYFQNALEINPGNTAFANYLKMLSSN
ncbi:MAG: tetratricopeptide (TPR) repeat protein [Bacteroidia bacterium]|jgi:tetratricopeptide (TPR) repeat protein